MSGTILDFNTAKKQGEARYDEISAEDIRSRLHADPKPFIEWLYSGRAIFSRRDARIGDTSGQAGESLSINLQGADAGLWYDHATGEGGDLIDLYSAYRGFPKGRNFMLAVKEIARDFFHEAVTIADPPKWLPTPTEQIDQKKHTLGTKPKAENLQLGAP